MGPFLHIGIAVATAISAWCNALGLAFILKRRGYFTLDLRNLARLPRMIVASLIMGAVLFSSPIFFNNIFIYEIPINFIMLATLVFVGLIIYLSSSFLLGSVKWAEFRQLFKR
jgi:putative peptidoglycan lipid II flippase